VKVLVELLIPVAGFSVYVAAQFILYRVTRSLVKSVICSYLVGLLSVPTMHVVVLGGLDLEGFFVFVTNVLVYTGSAYCYFGIIGLGVSLRIRVLDIIAQSPEGMTFSQIEERFDSKSLFGRRIERLLENKQIRREGDRYFIARPGFLLVSRLNTLVKRFLTGKSSEFDDRRG